MASARLRRFYSPTLFLGSALLLLTASRLWLDAGLRLKAEAGQGLDDGLYARLAQSILNGTWLGPFDYLTFAKVPGYPLWIAATHRLGIPLLIAQSALQSAAGLLFVFAARRAGLPRVLALVTYALYLFNPFVEVRLLREGIYGSLLVMTVAAGIMLSTAIRSGRHAVGPALFLGVTTAFAWLTREEGVMVLPAIIAVAVPDLFRALWGAPAARTRIRIASIGAIPAAVVLGAIGAISFANLQTYGVFRVSDQNAPPFSTAYGAILSVKQEHPIPYLHVPPDVRGRVYRASPSYASLGPYIDGSAGSAEARAGLSKMTCGFYPHICGEVGGNWAMWIFRLALADAGHYQTAQEADRFLTAVASEIDTACTVGALACGQRQSTVLPPLRPGDLSRILHYANLGTRWVLQFPVSDYVFDLSDRSPTSAEGARWFGDLTGSPIRPVETDPPWRVDRSVERKLAVFRGLTEMYQTALAPLTVLALALLIAWMIACVFRRRLPALLVVSCALLVGFASRLALLAYAHAMLFPAFGNWPSYVTPLYPLLLLFVGVTLSGVATEVSAWWEARRAEGRAVSTSWSAPGA